MKRRVDSNQTRRDVQVQLAVGERAHNSQIVQSHFANHRNL
jgi:hypothetical protein